MKIVIQFRFQRSTKNTHVFEEIAPEGQSPVVGSLYVQQFAMKEPKKALTVTIEDAE